MKYRGLSVVGSALLLFSMAKPVFAQAEDVAPKSTDPYAMNYNMDAAIQHSQPDTASRGHAYFQLQGGVAASKVGQDQAVSISDSNQDTFTADGNRAYDGVFGVGFGYRWQLGQSWQLDTGLAYYYFANSTVKGNILPAGVSDNVTYQYDIGSQALFAELALTYAPQNAYVMPFISLDLGLGRNRASNYSYTDPDNTYTSPSFGENTKSGVAYGVGLGLRWQALQQVAFSLAYHYFDLGKTALANGTGYGGYVSPGLTSGSITPSVLTITADISL